MCSVPEREAPIGRQIVAYRVKVQGRVGIMDFDGKYICRRATTRSTPITTATASLDLSQRCAVGLVDLETRKATPPLWHQIKAARRAPLLPVRDGNGAATRTQKENAHSGALRPGGRVCGRLGERHGRGEVRADRHARRRGRAAVFRTVFDVFPERARVLPVNSRGWVTRKGRLMGISEDDIRRAG